jgi:hypothetical protein
MPNRELIQALADAQERLLEAARLLRLAAGQNPPPLAVTRAPQPRPKLELVHDDG